MFLYINPDIVFDFMAPPRIELGAPLRERGILPLDYGAFNSLISGSYKINYIGYNYTYTIN